MKRIAYLLLRTLGIGRPAPTSRFGRLARKDEKVVGFVGLAYIALQAYPQPQSGERIIGRVNLQALRSHHPGRPSGFDVRRIVGKGDLWITEYIITYQGRPTFTVSIMEFRDGKVRHETQYFADSFEAPDWRSQWVERTS
jgi:hypothetical protein